MIWLPGVLSQGGKKFTWARYSLKSGAVAQGSETWNVSPSYKYFASDYFINSSDQFELIDAVYQGLDKMTVGQYFIGRKAANTTTGDVLCKVTKMVEIESYLWDITYTYYALEEGMKGDYIDVVQSSNPAAYPENGAQGDYWYVKWSDEPIAWERYEISHTAVQGSKKSNSDAYRKYLKLGSSYSIVDGQFAVKVAQNSRITSAQSSFTNKYAIEVDGTILYNSAESGSVGKTDYGSTLAEVTQISLIGSQATIYWYPYTLSISRGSYIDTIESYIPDEFPDDGIQDGYWYVKI